jgi:arginine/lysine/ornithine decarboxylase
MLYLALKNRKSSDSRPVIAATRNAHKAFIYACALLDLEVDWLYPTAHSHLCECKISPQELDMALRSADTLPDAVYVTSPDYMGNIMDVRGLSDICHSYGIPLLVDNAHGAYLAFLDESRHPIHLGADMCCDSAHKTLPALTGGAYLHVSSHCSVDREELRGAMALFASTSPSYLIMQSLDMANKYLSEGYKEELVRTAERVSALKTRLVDVGFSLVGDEPMKICIETKKYGYFGLEIAEYLKENNIICEFYDKDHLVMMFTPEIGGEDFTLIEKALTDLPKKGKIEEYSPAVGKTERKMSIREAIMSPSVETEVENALGRVLSNATVSCPPAIPIAVCGELIDENTIELFKYYGIEKCRVVK